MGSRQIQLKAPFMVMGQMFKMIVFLFSQNLNKIHLLMVSICF